MGIGFHMHYNVYLHMEPEALFRLSITHARILGGHQLFREFADDSVMWKRDQKKIIEQLQTHKSPSHPYSTTAMWTCGD